MSAYVRAPRRREALDRVWHKLVQEREARVYPPVTPSALRVYRCLADGPATGLTTEQLLRCTKFDKTNLRRACAYLACLLIIYASGTAEGRAQVRLIQARVERRKAGMPMSLFRLDFKVLPRTKQ